MNAEKTIGPGQRLVTDVLEPMKQMFVGKDEIIDLLGICLVARENLFLLGPPGTAKSALVQELAKRIEGKVFDYLLTRFSEPNEIFGPFDIRKLRDGELVTNTEGMLPEATFVFLDELLNANSAILNSLLQVLNERIFRRGRETRKLPTLMIVGASNRLPEDDALWALFDRFLVRVRCDNVHAEQLTEVLEAGWELELKREDPVRATFRLDDVGQLQKSVSTIGLTDVHVEYVELIHRLRHAGIMISDRRAVKLQRLLAASAVLCDRTSANLTDFWVLKHVWDSDDQRTVLEAIVNQSLEMATDEEKSAGHLQSRCGQVPDAELLSRDLEQIELAVERGVEANGKLWMQDRVGILASRCQWVADEQAREFLVGRTNALIVKLGELP